MRTKLAALLALVLSAPAFGQQHAIAFPSPVSFETGDTWSHEGRKFRLFGVQSCIRGTTYHLPDGEEGDCGMRSIASLAALFSTGTIACQPIGAAESHVMFVVCAAQIDGATIDVGTALISSGAAFAATLPSGVPVTSVYAVAESTAKGQRNGLWAGTFDHPVAVLTGRP
jgi:endonuclease YncB( thermonuclease family)